jgi:anti-sigma regulatory factor (Ser/Thr protein kinase)
MKAERQFPNSVDSVTAARRFVTESLSDLTPETLDLLTLMVSELATNCVIHATTGFRVTLNRNRYDIRIEVTDTGAGTATMQTPSPQAPHGRGLRIVDSLAHNWGVTRQHSGNGKTVWITVPLTT